MTKKRYLQVIVEVPDEATVAETKDYIRTELMAAGGQYRVDDALHSGVSTVSIKSFRFESDAKRIKRIPPKPLLDIT